MKRIVPVLACLLTVGASPLAMARYEDQDSESIRLGYVPSEVRQLVVVRPEKILKNDAVRELKQLSGEVFDKMLNRMMNQYFKFSLTDFDEIEYILQADWFSKREGDNGRRSRGNNTILLVKTINDQTDKFDMATHAVKSEAEYKGQTIFQMNNFVNRQYKYACILDEKSIVWARHDYSIKQMIDVGPKGPKNSELLNAWNQFSDSPMSFAIQIPQREMRFAPPNLQALENMEFAAAGIKLGKTATIKVMGLCNSDDGAEKVMEAAEQNLDLGKQMIQRRAAADAKNRDIYPILLDFAESIEMKQQGKEVQATASANINVKSLAKPLKQVYEAQVR
ncbi:MAG: hypothetical protein AAGA30_07380, partial [Planctomycetota bacterium]